MRSLQRAAMVAATLVLATGAAVAAASPSPSLTPGPAAAGLEGPLWVPLIPGDQPTPAGVVTLAFLDGIVSGQAPCNQFSGLYQLEGATLAIGPISATQLDCPDKGLEQAYLAELAAATGWAVTDGDLVLTDAAGAELGRFAAATSGD